MVQLVGILNVTPDSFSDGGLFIDAKKAIEKAGQLFSEGASIVDVGAESTRPGAIPLSEELEWQRLEAVLRQLLGLYPGKISLDTYKPGIVARAFSIAPVIVNDVTGMNNPAMIDAVVKHGATCIISHMDSTDIQATHEQKPTQSIEEVRDALLAKAAKLIKLGHARDKIILDPGIGFGKSPELNAELLKFAEVVPDYPVMIGYSKKRFLGENRFELAPNLAAGRTAATTGAAYLRVHDVKGHDANL